MSGKSRDEDGTIDRVRDPPKELLPLLYAMRMSCEAYHIGSLEDAMLAAGGTHYGVIPTTKFGSCIATLFPRLGLTEENMLALVTAYGCGDKVPERSHRAKLQPFDMCAWADFAEDVQKAVDPYAGSADLPGRAANIYPQASDIEQGCLQTGLVQQGGISAATGWRVYVRDEGERGSGSLAETFHACGVCLSVWVCVRRCDVRLRSRWFVLRAFKGARGTTRVCEPSARVMIKTEISYPTGLRFVDVGL